MDSRQAQGVMGEVLQALENLTVGDYKLVGVVGEKRSVTGYSVYVRTFLGAARKQEFHQVLEKYGLSMTEDKEGIIIK